MWYRKWLLRRYHPLNALRMRGRNVSRIMADSHWRERERKNKKNIAEKKEEKKEKQANKKLNNISRGFGVPGGD